MWRQAGKDGAVSNSTSGQGGHLLSAEQGGKARNEKPRAAGLFFRTTAFPLIGI